jgi:SEC-C motif
MSRKKISRNDPCPCGSGKKYKNCCYGKGVEDDLGVASGRQRPQYPIGTVAMYGPDDKTTTKIAAGVILRDGAEAIMQRWVATDVTTNPKVQQELKDFFLQHGVKQVAMSQGNMGCPHEEGEDFPHGEDCPFCPFWKGKQGSNRKD